jgi:hypothetical protein
MPIVRTSPPVRTRTKIRTSCSNQIRSLQGLLLVVAPLGLDPNQPGSAPLQLAFGIAALATWAFAAAIITAILVAIIILIQVSVSISMVRILSVFTAEEEETTAAVAVHLLLVPITLTTIG